MLAGGSPVASAEETKRFRWDFKRTQAELNDDAYAGALRSLAHQRGLKLSIEAYDPTGGFLNPLTYGSEADLPMAEFWITRWSAWHLLSPRLLASVGHVYGKPIVGAESFTAWAESDPFIEHPYSVKAIGDWAFCEGINRFVFHRSVLQPWTNCAPGMSFGGFGCPRQPARQLTLDARALHLRDQVGPFVGVGAVVIQFLRAVGVTDVAPSVGANAVVALVVRRNRRPGALRRRVFQLRQEALTFESGPAGRRVRSGSGKYPITRQAGSTARLGLRLDRRR